MIEQSDSVAGGRGRLAGLVALAAAGAVLVALALGTAWPSTSSDRTVAVGPSGAISDCYAFDTPRLMVVEIDTAGGGAVAAGIVPRERTGGLTAETMASHTVAGAYAASLAAGRIDARVDAERDYCVVLFGTSASQMVRAKVESYPRLW